jgi:hypothetical protein
MARANDVAVGVVSAVRLRDDMVELTRLSTDALQTVETAIALACQQCRYEAAIRKEVERFNVEFDDGCAFGQAPRNFRRKENADEVAIAGAVFDLYAAAFMQGTDVFADRALGNAQGVGERKEGEERRRFTFEMRVP